MEKPTEVAALLLCPLHLQLFEDPVLCPCGHTFCRACITAEIASSGKCPFDGTELHLNAVFPNQIIAEEVKAFLRNGGSLSPIAKPVPCSFESYGCEWKGPAEALSTHLENCDYDKMKDFILRKEREAATLREEVRSKDQRIVELQQLLSANSTFSVELQRVLKLAMSLATQGKNAVERGVGHVVGGITHGWVAMSDEKNYQELSQLMEHTAERCANSVKKVIDLLQASKHISDAEILGKLVAQTASWKEKLAQVLEDIRETFARISVPPQKETAEEQELREVTRESLRCYLKEVQRMNEAQEQEQTDFVQGVVASLPPAPSASSASSVSSASPSSSASTISSASSSSSASTSSSTSTTGELSASVSDPQLAVVETDGFVEIPRRPLPAVPSAQLRN